MKKDKYLQIFNYLREFSQISSKPVRDIEKSETQYPEISWLGDLPQHPLIECITFPDFDKESDYLIKVTKPKEKPIEPKFQTQHYNFSDWLVESSLVDEKNGPKLYEKIVKDNETLYLSDYPEVKNEFQEYISTNWHEELVKYKEEYEIYKSKLLDYNRLNDIYKQFFSIYNKAEQFGEEYELILGVGLLKFKENETTPQISRHIFTIRAEINFESNQRASFIKVSTNIESEIHVETDSIIDLSDHFDIESIIEAEKKYNEFIQEKRISDLFDENMKEAIQIFADRLHADSKFVDELKKPNEISRTPIIYFAPALILRKRNTKSFTALYDKIIEDIKNDNNNIDLTAINELVGIDNEDENDRKENKRKVENSIIDDTIYFPKPYNDEQIEIINKIQKNDKILVQGPPGTGKTHTIANLICHLLANGKKILVTAYTKRALEVLKNQLPEEFKKLTVNLLSGDTTSLHELESSINSINDQLSKGDINKYKKEIESLEIELDKTKELIATTTNKLHEVQEKSTRIQTINKYYQGTLLEIAEKIEEEAQSFSWYKDSFIDLNNKLIIDEVAKFYSLYEKYKDIDRKIFDLEIPSKDNVISVDELSQYMLSRDELSKHYPGLDCVNTITSNNYSELKNNYEKLYQASISIEKSSFINKTNLIKDYPHNLSTWEEKFYRTKEILDELNEKKLKELDKSVEIIYPHDKSLMQLKNDAQVLLQYLQKGNKLSGIFFNFKKIMLPREIKEKLYFIKEVKINGSLCDTTYEFEKVLYDIKIKQDFLEIETIWGIHKYDELKHYNKTLKYYQKYINDYINLLSSLQNFQEAKSKIELNSSLKVDTYNSGMIRVKLGEIDFNILVDRINFYEKKISITIHYLFSTQNHPIAQSLINDIQNLDLVSYRKHIAKIDDIIYERANYYSFKSLQTKLNHYFPFLISDILQGSLNIEHIQQLSRAISFKDASSKISELFDDNYEKKLHDRLPELEKNQNKIIEQLSSKKAWAVLLERLQKNPNLAMHLTAWKQAAKNIPKTKTSPNYIRRRKIAQQEMENCKTAIPCWIMPLYQVVDNFKPEPNIFDYIIIDEASQLGPDALFLFYLGAKIIVLGDDKQTAPEHIGVFSNTFESLIQKHLNDIPFKDFYGSRYSFFDHVDRLCAGQRIVLREHFRCMPEIIEFSNKYFYEPDGKRLYPLRQYSENRLEPLKNVYCPNGYIEGQNYNIINRVEAEEIAKKISELVNDERYNQKTFGVISLQGYRQSDLIESLLLEKIGETEYHKRKIICGNSASFQGDERDVIFLSLVTAHNHNRISLVKPEDERRFNVAVSRAKDQIWLFHSVQLEDLGNTDDLRYKLLNHFLNYKPQINQIPKPIERKLGTQPAPFESWFEVDVFNDIISRGYSVYPQYEVANGKYRIDLVALLKNGVKIAIECDGDKYHSAEQFQNDMMRQKVLERCGWQFFRVRGVNYYTDRKKALEPLWKILDASNEEVDNLPVNQYHIDISEADTVLSGNDNIVLGKVEPEPEIQSTLLKPRNINNLDQNGILVFTSFQNVYKINDKQFNSKLEILEQMKNYFEPNEKTIYITISNGYSGYLIVGFENGRVGKITLNSYKLESDDKKITNAFNNESKLIFIEKIEDDIDLVLVSSINKVVIFNTSQIHSVVGRTNKGVQVMKLIEGSRVVKIKKLNQTKIKTPNYYRINRGDVAGRYLRPEDTV